MNQNISNNLISKNNIKPTVALELFYLAYFLKMIVGATSNSSLFFSGIMVIIGVSSMLYILIIKKMNYKSKIVIAFIIYFIFGIITSLYTGNYRPQEFLIVIQYFGIGLILLKYTLNYKVVKMSFFLYSAFFAINIVIGKHPDELFIGFSRNSISVLMILHSILYYISMYQNKIKLSLYPAIVTVVFSFWAIGRSGILSSLLLLVIITVYIQMKNSSKNFKIIYLTMFLYIVYLVLVTFFYDEILSGAFQRTIRLGLFDPHRMMIITEYVNNIKNSLGSFFWGVSIYNNDIFSIYDYNLHNSYLRLHAFHGIFGTLIILTLILRSVVKYLKIKEYLYLGLLIVILLRMSTDIVAFHGPYDPLIYFFTFNALILKKMTKKEIKNII